MNAVLDLQDVSKAYPGNPPVFALENVSLRVNTGEYIGIVGPSGSGKSTLLNIIGALNKPTTGRVQIDGIDISSLSDNQLSTLRGRKIGFVFQSFNLLPELSALENVSVGLLYAGIPKKQRYERALHVLETVGLKNRAKHRPSELSGGERQRVAIARALALEPALLLADEPTGNLDSSTGQTILELFSDLHKNGSTIVLITHDRELAEALPRQITIRDGHLIQDSGSYEA